MGHRSPAEFEARLKLPTTSAYYLWGGQSPGSRTLRANRRGKALSAAHRPSPSAPATLDDEAAIRAVGEADVEG
jgi:hypothetical protein